MRLIKITGKMQIGENKNTKKPMQKTALTFFNRCIGFRAEPQKTAPNL